MYDLITKNTKKILDTDYAVNDLVYTPKMNKLFIAGKGIREYDIET